MLPLFMVLLLLQADALGVAQKIDPLPTFPDGMSVIGVYDPNTQLLAECTSTDIVKLRECDGFISGVVQATGLITAAFPKGPIALPIPKDYNEIVVEPRNIVINYINALPNSRMSEPAAYSVYAALVARYPYKGPHEKDIPLVIK